MYYVPTQIRKIINIDCLYSIHYFEYHKDYIFTGEKHDFWELMYVDKGEVIVTRNDKELILKQNQLILYAPNEFHSVRANGSVAPNTIIVSFGCNDEVLSKISNRIFYINSYERSLLAGIVREAGSAYKTNLADPTYRSLTKDENQNNGAEQMILNYLEILLIEFLRSNSYVKKDYLAIENESHLKERFLQLEKWINEHIDKSFTINDLCSESMLGKSALEALFKKNTGMSAIEYCRKAKIKAAKKMLREEVYNISQISELLGFSSVHYFSRTFKLVENITPTEYAKSVKAVIDHTPLMKETDERKTVK